MRYRLTDREIAEQLGIGVRTAEGHVASLIGKLGAGNRRAVPEAAKLLGLN